MFPFVLFSFFVLQCHAQTSEIFQWQFSNNYLSVNLPTCQTLPITVEPYNPNNDTHGVPPFYMIAYEVGGTPRTTMIGPNETDLNWQVDHPVGTNLMLNVVDSQGSSGGLPPRLYTVVTGQSTSCIPTPDTSQSPFTVTANVSSFSTPSTGNLTTCQPWGIFINGGVPPYNLSLNALNSPNVTNLTLPGTDNAFLYINRANPNTILLAAISDFTGRYATGTPAVYTQGSSDSNCVGLVSASGNATQWQQAAGAAAAAKRHHKTSVIVGVCVTVGVLLIIAGVLGTVWWTRKRKLDSLRARRIGLDDDPKEYAVPEPFYGNGQGNSSWTSPTSPTTNGNPKSPGGMTINSNNDPFDPYRLVREASMRPSDTSSGSGTGRPGLITTLAGTSSGGRRSAKSIEASSIATLSRQQSSSALSPAASEPPPLPADGLREVVIQHQDGGDAVVRELPPPYADRTRQLALRLQQQAQQEQAQEQTPRKPKTPTTS